jgi:hypothetical protein
MSSQQQLPKHVPAVFRKDCPNKKIKPTLKSAAYFDVMEINMTYFWDIILKNPVKTLDSFGLFLDIVGALLIFKYGLPKSISREGHISIILEQEDEQEKKKAKFYDQRARMGLVFLILGFLFQFVSNFV